MSRSKWKFINVSYLFLSQLKKKRKNLRKVVLTQRSFHIFPFVLQKFFKLSVYNGKFFNFIESNHFLVGQKFGSFVSTRKKFLR